MKKILLSTILLITIQGFSQSCDEMMDYVKKGNFGTTYNSYSSSVIQKVTFYDKMIDYQSYYFAIVCFKNDFYGCSEYIYQVGSRTKFNYSLDYYSSAGKAFWKHIEPYNANLDCAPDFE